MSAARRSGTRPFVKCRRRSLLSHTILLLFFGGSRKGRTRQGASTTDSRSNITGVAPSGTALGQARHRSRSSSGRSPSKVASPRILIPVWPRVLFVRAAFHPSFVPAVCPHSFVLSLLNPSCAGTRSAHTEARKSNTPRRCRPSRSPAVVEAVSSADRGPASLRCFMLAQRGRKPLSSRARPPRPCCGSVRDQPPYLRCSRAGHAIAPAWLSLAALPELLSNSGLVPIVPRRLDEAAAAPACCRLRDRPASLANLVEFSLGTRPRYDMSSRAELEAPEVGDDSATELIAVTVSMPRKHPALDKARDGSSRHP